MKVLPNAKVQTLSECEPSQLVRSLEYRGKGRLGVVSDMTETGLRGIVYLADEPPFFEGEQRPNDATVLAYSGEIVWEIDQAGPVETSARELFSKSGCIIYNENGWLINVAVGYGATLRQMQFNINTGQLSYYQQQLQKVAIFGAWSAFLEDKERPFEGRIKIASFDIRSTGQDPL